MGTHTTPPPGFHRIKRLDEMLQERVHDPYRARSKPKEPSTCPRCGAVFHDGRWEWREAPEGAHQEMCPACHRINDQYPAGFLTLKGQFFATHREEILHLARNVEKRERTEHPLNRIIAIEEEDDGMLLTTTDIHLVRGIGEAIHDAYQGDLDFHYNPDEYLLRVAWER
ncbi:MAG TPA: BCAM0308 family protein [Nitrosospira sp.]|nr:BCAM0308 family protein [Nitrosospira sp.]